MEAEDVCLAVFQRLGKVINELRRIFAAGRRVVKLSRIRAVNALARHYFTGGLAAPSVPRVKLPCLKVAILEHCNNVSVSLYYHLRSYQRQEVCLLLLRMPNEVVTEYLHVLRCLGKESIELCRVERAAARHHCVHLHGVTGNILLEVVVAQRRIVRVVLVEILVRRKADADRRAGHILGHVVLYVVVMVDLLLQLQRNIVRSHGVVAVGRMPVHLLVVTADKQKRACQHGEYYVIQFHDVFCLLFVS